MNGKLYTGGINLSKVDKDKLKNTDPRMREFSDCKMMSHGCTF